VKHCAWLVVAMSSMAVAQNAASWKFTISGDSRNCGDIVMDEVDKRVSQDAQAALPERKGVRVKEATVRTFVYPAKFERGDKSGVLVITFRDIPQAITQGKGEKDALWPAADCLEEAIAGRIADGREIPKASRTARGERLIPVPAPMAAKAALYLAMETPESPMCSWHENSVATRRRFGGCSIEDSDEGEH